MELLKIKKQQFIEVINEVHPNAIDGFAKDSAWQKEERKAHCYCNYEKVGRGLYTIYEMYNVPKERVHGNSGITPANKGTIRKSSNKFILALAISQIGSEYQSKSKYLEKMGLKSRNLQNVDTMMRTIQYQNLSAVDKAILEEVQLIETSLNRCWTKAIELLEGNEINGINLKAKLFVAFKNGKHKEASEVFENPEELYLIYNTARQEADDLVEYQYGKSLVYSAKTHLSNKFYEALIKEKMEYELLEKYEVDFFYNKYAIEGQYEGESVEDSFAKDFFVKFLNGRKKRAKNNMGRKLNLSKNENMVEAFVEQLFDLFFQSNTTASFKKRLAEVTKAIKAEKEKKLDELVEENMDFLPFNAM